MFAADVAMPAAPTSSPAPAAPTTTSQPPSALPALGLKVTEDVRPAAVSLEFFELIIYNQVGVVFNDKVKALASANSVGPFSVLPAHTNFISMITAPVTAYLMNGETRTFEAGLGVLRCYHNRVEVYAGLHVSKEAENLARRLQAADKEVVRGEEVKGEAAPPVLVEAKESPSAAKTGAPSTSPPVASA